MTNDKFYPISDDLMFSTVFGNNPDLAKELLETILQEKIGDLIVWSAQKTLNIEVDRKFVKIDMYAETDKMIYDAEMESPDKKRAKEQLPRRSFYYAASALTDSTAKGTDYQDIKGAVILFFCMFDPFDKGLPHYTFTPSCREDPEVTFDDDIRFEFFNCLAAEQEKNESIRQVLSYFAGGSPEGNLARDVQKEVIRYNEDRGWRKSRMTLEEEMRMMRKYDREEGRKEGIEIGIEKGKEEGRKEGKEEGIEIGRKEGKEEGIEIGRKEGIDFNQKKIILNMLAQGFTDRQILSCVPEYTEEKLEELRRTHPSLQAS